jgi:hypothetical protein
MRDLARHFGRHQLPLHRVEHHQVGAFAGLDAASIV